MNIYSILLDLLILLVLGITITFCLKLNKRILELQSNKKDIAEFISALDNSILNAHKSITTLQSLTEKVSNERQKYMDEGARLADDLSFMIQSGNRLIQRCGDESSKLSDNVEKSKIFSETLNQKINEAQSKIEFLKRNQYKNEKKQSEKIIIQTT